jgi:hypothetical protein
VGRRPVHPCDVRNVEAFLIAFSTLCLGPYFFIKNTV